MASGREIRSNIDTENVKGLLLINGGGAIALLAFLPSILGIEEYRDLVRAVVWGIMGFQVGLVTAVMHNFWRRRCSLAWEQDRNKCQIFGKPLFEPCICYWSHGFMFGSLLCFVAACVKVALAALAITAP
ncbi:hypothetical protein [Marinobacter bohaiensis]|uniref:hypothetical protein n=1 Tax=Marinobacter bohaiensis TaxID=2201898 RepID=UPI0013A6DDE9|nr:hypothetical protein [Marinobacter bohaiensis]